MLPQSLSPSYFDTVATEHDAAKDNQKEKSWYGYTQEKAGESVYWCVLHDVPFFERTALNTCVFC
ncbi:MAG: hypothetical protein IPP97_27805 [Candidatus Obscuribacter sp.]|nr:hypothetical protein [Candidatus Obscuribacter sp.]